MKISLSAVILTFNEEIHIERCIKSLQPVCDKIFVIDSFSNDKTVEICKSLGVNVSQNRWKTYADQFQWGLDNCSITSEWTLRMDADEYFTIELQNEIQQNLPDLQEEITGIYLNRRVYFLDRWIKHGGYYPIKLLRIWRTGIGSIEQRWMDEHIKLNHGKTTEFKNDIIDCNLNSLTWWTNKHNSYATREAVDILSSRGSIDQIESISSTPDSNRQDEKKRWLKDNIYGKTPLFVRPFLYFIYRYFFKLGFLDGKAGLIWHILQGFWYRFLVDAKIYQIEKISKDEKLTIREVLIKYYDFRI